MLTRPDPNTDAGPDRYVDTDPCSDCHSDTAAADADRSSNGHPDRHAYSETYRDSHCNLNPASNRDSNADFYAVGHPYAYPATRAHGDGEHVGLHRAGRNRAMGAVGSLR